MNTISFLLSNEAARLRMSARKPSFVVHVKLDLSVADRIVELDADDPQHASRIADTWGEREGTSSVVIRRCLHDGTLTDPITTMGQTFTIQPMRFKMSHGPDGDVRMSRTN